LLAARVKIETHGSSASLGTARVTANRPNFRKNPTNQKEGEKTMMKAHRILRLIANSRRFFLTAMAIPILLASADSALAQSVTKIEVRLRTGSNGTDAAVFLGLGGREFNLDLPDKNDREPNDNDTYILGAGANVAVPGDNDPRLDLPLSVSDVNNFPIYIRMDGQVDDAWSLREVEVRVNPSSGPVFTRFISTSGLIMDDHRGLIFYVKR
jgi:hypothetical protein